MVYAEYQCFLLAALLKTLDSAQISRLTDKAYCFFCFLAIIHSF